MRVYVKKVLKDTYKFSSDTFKQTANYAGAERCEENQVTLKFNLIFTQLTITRR